MGSAARERGGSDGGGGGGTGGHSADVARWNDSLERLRAFLAASGGRYPRQAADDKEERFLGGFVIRQRNARGSVTCRAGQMTTERSKKLEGLSGWQWHRGHRSGTVDDQASNAHSWAQHVPCRVHPSRDPGTAWVRFLMTVMLKFQPSVAVLY